MTRHVLLTLEDEDAGELRLVREGERVFVEIDQPRWEVTRPVFADALALALQDAFPIIPLTS